MREKAEKPAKRKLTRNQRKQIEAVIRQAKGDGKNHTVQDSIPFQNMFPDGLCRLEGGTFSKTIAFEDVNYRLAGPEDQRSIFESLCDFYNGYDPSIGVQVSLDSRSGGSAADELFGITRQGNDLDPIRDEAVDILRMQYKRGNNGYVKEIDPGLHALQAEVGGDIAASYPFDDPVGLVLNDEGKLIGLDLNRSLRDEHGEIYDIVAGTFLVVGLGSESFASLPPDMIQKYTEQFKRPELFASINGQIVSVPVEPENPLRTAEMTLEDDYGMIDGIINNGRRGEELEKAQAEARRTTPEKKPSIRERLKDAKRECAERKSPDKPAPQKKPPELGDL